MSIFTPLFLLFDTSETARCVRGIRSGAPDRNRLDRLRETLVHDRTSVPERHLWWLIDAIDGRTDPGEDSETDRVLVEIYRSANWELQSRYRAT